MNKKIFFSNFLIFLLIIGVLQEFALRVNVPVCRETESTREIRKIEEAVSKRNDCGPFDSFQDIDAPALTSSIQNLNFFAAAFEPKNISFCLYFIPHFLNHSPPVF